MKFEFNGPVVLEEKMFENVNGWTMDGRRTGKGHGVTRLVQIRKKQTTID